MSAVEAAVEPEGSGVEHRGWGFIALYTLAYMGAVLVLMAPLLVMLALKVSSPVGIEQAPNCSSAR